MYPGKATVTKSSLSEVLQEKDIENFTPPKTGSFQKRNLIFFIFLLETYIMDTRYNSLAEAVLTSTHNLCF